ncbi:MAG TPA: (2Fe-2S) ferredoxin domain-containing protein [Clostridia bacterium]|nr:(2Fe-2S) ferredoxin domain-containing protein [Clostridia bacterium]
MKTLEELERIKTETTKKMGVREEGDKVNIIVGMGTCGIAAGAREVMLAILDEVSKRNLTNVTVTQTGCIGMCAQEPLVEVDVPGKPKMIYGKMDGPKSRQVVAQHVVNGIAISEWLVK